MFTISIWGSSFGGSVSWDKANLKAACSCDCWFGNNPPVRKKKKKGSIISGWEKWGWLLNSPPQVGHFLLSRPASLAVTFVVGVRIQIDSAGHWGFNFCRWAFLCDKGLWDLLLCLNVWLFTPQLSTGWRDQDCGVSSSSSLGKIT